MEAVEVDSTEPSSSQLDDVSDSSSSVVHGEYVRSDDGREGMSERIAVGSKGDVR